MTAPAPPPSGRVAITDAAIAIDPLNAMVQRAGAGGTALFVGTVRDEADGLAVTLLEYEAYRPMALAEMERCVAEIEARDPTLRLAVTHRLGALRVGDVAIVCAASAPHRGEAFAACRALIDAIKARVPIWKREHGPDGAYWVGWRDARCDEHGHGHASDEGAAHGDGHGHGHGHGHVKDDGREGAGER